MRTSLEPGEVRAQRRTGCGGLQLRRPSRLLVRVYAAALLLVSACGGSDDDLGEKACASRACLAERGYECRSMGGTYAHCVGRQEGYAMSAEYICKGDMCVEKPFEGPVTGALLNNLAPSVFESAGGS